MKRTEEGKKKKIGRGKTNLYDSMTAHQKGRPPPRCAPALAICPGSLLTFSPTAVRQPPVAGVGPTNQDARITQSANVAPGEVGS